MSKQRNSEVTYHFATIGSRTERGGRVTTSTSGLTICGLGIARVGDVVTYRDGSEAVVIDGAGAHAVCDGRPLALVGSRVSNGDCIVETLQDSWGICVLEAEENIGLFDSSYVPPPAPPRYRLAVRGATTARGGALLEPGGGGSAETYLGRAGTIGDLIHYSDGSTARVISGLGLTDSRDFTPLAFVGSELDNGDVITDSPERGSSLSSETFIVVRRSDLTDGGQTA
jgi:uncharacterized Zn-binding protein involved in type VI secretion